MFKSAFIVFIGGGLGSLFRYLINTWVSGTLPLSTILVNIISCLILGLIVGYLTLQISYASLYNNSIYLLIATGFCGGLSTFSTFTFDNYKILYTLNGSWLLFIINILANLIVCYGCLIIGIKIGRMF